jgi:type I restriction enzyme S subunit
MELPVLLPPGAEQLAILERVDTELSKLEALQASSLHAVALLKERRSALIAAAVTGHIDVRGAVPISWLENP